MQFDLPAGTFLNLLGNLFIHNRELEFIRLHSIGIFAVIAGLNHLTLIGFEHKTLFLEIIDISFIDSFAKDKAELKENIEEGETEDENTENTEA